ncbi:hypothetical protein AAAX30_02485 [Slackia piriformis]|nr:hypothetical protein [Slackia piriformis]
MNKMRNLPCLPRDNRAKNETNAQEHNYANKIKEINGLFEAKQRRQRENPSREQGRQNTRNTQQNPQKRIPQQKAFSANHKYDKPCEDKARNK